MTYHTLFAPNPIFTIIISLETGDGDICNEMGDRVTAVINKEGGKRGVAPKDVREGIKHFLKRRKELEKKDPEFYAFLLQWDRDFLLGYTHTPNDVDAVEVSSCVYPISKSCRHGNKNSGNGGSTAVQSSAFSSSPLFSSTITYCSSIATSSVPPSDKTNDVKEGTKHFLKRRQELEKDDPESYAFLLQWDRDFLLGYTHAPNDVDAVDGGTEDVAIEQYVIVNENEHVENTKNDNEPLVQSLRRRRHYDNLDPVLPDRRRQKHHHYEEENTNYRINAVTPEINDMESICNDTGNEIRDDIAVVNEENCEDERGM
jgi:hypothetical protein